MINDAADLYKLDVETVSGLDRMAEKSASNLIREIDKSKKTTFARFLYALGIRHVGETTARSLAEHFGNIVNLKQATEEQLLEVDDIGPIVASSVKQFFSDERNLTLVEKLQDVGIHWPEKEMKEKPEQLPLAKQKIRFDGNPSFIDAGRGG